MTNLYASAVSNGCLNFNVNIDGDGSQIHIQSNVNDVIVEPARKKMIPGFDKVKENALRSWCICLYN